MSKSVLVIDTPEKGCMSCPIGQDHSNILETCTFCPITGKCVLDKEAETIPDWCPLKPLPEKDDFDDPYEEYYTGYRDGWNRCLEEITSQGKEN